MCNLYLIGENTEAEFAAMFEQGGFELFNLSFNVAIGKRDDEKVKAWTQSEQALKDMSERFGKKVKAIQQRRTYYWLPLDSFNQPNGNVEEISLFPSDYEDLKNCNMQDSYPYWWIYDDYHAALERAHS